MPGIKFNQLSKEIEIRGSESFVLSNFHKIRDLLVKSIGVRKKMVSRNAKTKQESKLFLKMKESQTGAEISSHDLSETPPVTSAAESAIPEITHELTANRPPLRKYIRKVGIPGQQRIAVQVVERKPTEISLASLKEKFGLSESKIGGIIRDAEKLGKIRKAMNGSYVWTQE